MTRFLQKASLAVAAAAMIVSAAPAFAAGKWLRIENRRDAFPIWATYIIPSGASSWGADQLGGQTIAAGSSYSWNIDWDTCYVDVKSVTFTGLHVERYNVNICGGSVWTIYDQ